MKVLKRAAGAVVVFMTAIFVMGQNAVLAADPAKALKESGINPSTGDMSGIYKDLTGMVYVVMALGGFWVVTMLIIAGMKLSGSGGNPQKRTEGLIALVAAVGGAYVIFKAYDIAGWATGIGGAS